HKSCVWPWAVGGYVVFFLFTRLPRPPTSIVFPYTTLFRSNDACRGRWRSKGGRRSENSCRSSFVRPWLEVEQTARSRDDPLRRRHVRVLDLPVRIQHVVTGHAQDRPAQIQDRLLGEDRGQLRRES